MRALHARSPDVVLATIAPPELPFTDPILVFALAIAVFLIAPLALERAQLPGIVGIILVGAAIGPNALGLLERGETIVLLGQVGVVYLMFLAGLEIDLREFRENRSASVGFGLLSFALPQTVGTVVAVAALGFDWLTASLLASVFASHTLLAYPVVNRLDIGDDPAITATIGGTILTDTLALLVLAVVIGAHAGDLSSGFWLTLLGGLALFFVGTWTLVPRLGRWFFRTIEEESYFDYLFVILVAFAAAYAAELAGVEGIIGAFLAGIALNPQIPRVGVLMNRIEFVGNALFVPFFLLSIGMLVDPFALLAGPATLALTAALVAMTLATKAGASATAGWLFGWSPAGTAASFGLSAGQAAAALAVTLVGFEIGLFDRPIVNAVVLLILVISVVSPAVVDRYGRRIAAARAGEGAGPRDEPERVLVPLGRGSEPGERLLDVAMLLRDQSSPDPIYTVTVVPPKERRTTEAEIAAVEADAAATRSYAAGAEVPVDARTRISQNVASGVARAATEVRATTIVMGWDGARSRRQSTIGSTIDGVLRGTDQEIVVARVRKPLNAIQRVVCLLPPDVEHNPGVYESIHTVKRIADGTGAELVAYAIDGDRAAHQDLVDRVAPDVPVDVRAIESWSATLDLLKGEIGEGDLVVCVSARRGRMGWHPELQTLPKSISTLVNGDFLVVYLPTEPSGDERRFLKLR